MGSTQYQSRTSDQELELDRLLEDHTASNSTDNKQDVYNPGNSEIVQRILADQDWEDIADGFYTLTEHYEEITLEEGSEVFRELKENYHPTKREAEEALFNYSVEGMTLVEAIESELEYIN